MTDSERLQKINFERAKKGKKPLSMQQMRDGIREYRSSPQSSNDDLTTFLVLYMIMDTGCMIGSPSSVGVSGEPYQRVQENESPPNTTYSEPTETYSPPDRDSGSSYSSSSDSGSSSSSDSGSSGGGGGE